MANIKKGTVEDFAARFALQARESAASRGGRWRIGREEWHFHQRLWQRYDRLVLQFGEAEEIRAQILAGRAPLVMQKEQVAIHAVTFARHPLAPLLVMMSRRDHVFRTAYPPDSFILCDGIWSRAPYRPDRAMPERMPAVA